MKNYYKNNIKIFNSLLKKKEIFKPIKNDYVGMYVCGPTVYNKIHLGNCRTFITFDIIFRYLKFLNFKVKYVRNITDIGHVEENNEYKIIKRANLEGVNPMEIVKKYTSYFHIISYKLNIMDPNIEPFATSNINDQINLINKIYKKKIAYLSNGSIYFDIDYYNKKVKKYNLYYGFISNNKIKNIYKKNKKNLEKKNYNDFSLWKKNKNNIINYNSPWGKGIPGWHIECTAMSTKYLENKIDIHGGGIDLKFPHNECEFAQGKVLYGKKYNVKYWVYSNLLTINGKKMSKSLKNCLFPDEIFNGKIFKKKIHPIVFRFFLLQTHYRSLLNISYSALIAAEKGFLKLEKSIKILEKIFPKEKSTINIKKYIEKFYHLMNDDFNTPKVIAHFFLIYKKIQDLYNEKEFLNEEDLLFFKKEINNFFFNILGLKIINKNNKKNNKKESILLKNLINFIINLRNNERKKNNWKLSDFIRSELLKIGIKLIDNKKETFFKL
ncbi:cysteine--tRNA ligase [Candidatus Shikimatogenerans silvanidophilus]|uniref:cysteine--tRNA ligase n=1 Tax=Candidatus Shikimatogenerans silvanidophilus TaxID=2782547 RepID=UPI001BA58B8D|nr:cysteine--tRNA ligase [Candidatus Shikimatogenerans silvanidophilus]